MDLEHCISSLSITIGCMQGQCIMMEDASESKTEYLSFLEDEESEDVYKIRVMLMVDENRQRFIIIITINDLR